MTIFDILRDIIKDKSGRLSNDPEFQTAFKSYMVCRYLSMDRRFVNCADYVNKYGGVLTKEQLYHLLVKIVPRHQKTYIQYISKSSTKRSKHKKAKVSDDFNDDY